MPQPGTISPYGAGMNSMPGVVSPMFDQPVVSSIPAYPTYPGMENYAHNRIPEIQVPEIVAQEQAEGLEAGRAEASPVKNAKGVATKSGAKAKTSSQTTTAKAKTSYKTRSNSDGRQGAGKKSKNPWISN
jgi:morphogenetic protein associated with SpoVID